MIVLLLSLMLISCQSYHSDLFTIPSTLDVSALNNLIDLFEEKYVKISTNAPECPSLSNDVIVQDQGDDDRSNITYIVSKEDYLSIYQTIDYDFGGPSLELCTLVPQLTRLSTIFDLYKTKLTTNQSTIPNLTYQDSIEGIGELSYRLEVSPGYEGLTLTTTQGNIITTISISFAYDLLSFHLQTNELSHQIYDLSYLEGRFFVEQSASEEGISARKFNLVTGEILIYQNQDGDSYFYYNRSVHMSYFFNETTKSITYYNDYGPYFSYNEMIDGNVLLSWQLLEFNGWDYALIESNQYEESILGIYQEESLIFDSSVYYIDESLDTFRDFANVTLYMIFLKDEITSSTLMLSNFGLTPKFSPLTPMDIEEDFWIMDTFYANLNHPFTICYDDCGLELS